ncbi:MAG: NADH-quinone oxidoreductase subunit L [Bdellovibrionales bacterium]|nr:NADH-quinone oxidoreductase subunit L [Bdellovibrionales bacterium]
MMEFLLLSMILIPLLGSILNGLLLRSGSPARTGTLASTAAGLSFLAALLLCWNYLSTGQIVNVNFEWLRVGGLNLAWGFRFDAITVLMSLVVTGIGTLIHIFSIGYMDEEPTPYRFFAYLNLFLSAMLILVTGANLPVMFVGWEGVGLCSYLLIGYWYEDIKKADAGMKAFVINRIGDAGFLIGIFMLFQIFGTVDFESMKLIVDGSGSLNVRWLQFAAFFLFVGAMGKSAQIPLFTWLPDAMAGPTPVSALIHAATMVTAGVYLVARMGFLFRVSPDVSHFVATIGCATALFAASIATAQRDIKKILAYSTVSQLGFMFVALGVGAYSVALFHVMTHAFFKALLFLAAGTIIHGLHGEQDVCKMGGLRKHFPVTFITTSIAVAAICGLPPLSGFFSKDAIVFAALTGPYGGPYLWAGLSLASLLTAFYMSRFYFLVFFGEYRGNAHPHEGGWAMKLPLMDLAIGSAVVGFLGMPHGLHVLPNYLDQLLVPTVPGWEEAHAFLTEIQSMVVAVAVALTGIAIAAFFYLPNPARSDKAAPKLLAIDTILKNKYWVDELYEVVFVVPFRFLSGVAARIIDPRVIDAAVLFPSRLARAGGTLLTFIQSGSSQFYLWIMLTGGLLVLWQALKGLIV